MHRVAAARLHPNCASLLRSPGRCPERAGCTTSVLTCSAQRQRRPSFQLVAISASGVVSEGDAKREARRAALPREAPAHSSRTNRSVHRRSVHCARDRSRLLTLHRYPNAYIDTYVHTVLVLCVLIFSCSCTDMFYEYKQFGFNITAGSCFG